MSPILEAIVPPVLELLALVGRKRHWRMVAAIALAFALFVVGELAGIRLQDQTIEIAVFLLASVATYGVLTLVSPARARDDKEA